MKTVRHHEQEYFHVRKPGWDGVGRLLSFFGLSILSVVNWSLIITIGRQHKVWELLGSTSPEGVYAHWSQLVIVWPIIGEYVLLSLTVIAFVAVLKGGYDRLKKLSEEGLIYWLFWGLIGGLIMGLIMGLIAGLISGLIWGYIMGLIWGLIAGLIGGLIVGLIGGLINDFEQTKKYEKRGGRG